MKENFSYKSFIYFRAAFQFGVKMADGRKTRTKGGHLTEKQKLDREWQKISQVSEIFDSIDKTYFLTQ